MPYRAPAHLPAHPVSNRAAVPLPIGTARWHGAGTHRHGRCSRPETLTTPQRVRYSPSMATAPTAMTGIVQNLQALAAPLDELHLLEGNPRVGDVDAVAASLRRFGQRKPIVAKPDGTVIAGNHTLQAARQLGWTHIAVVRVDDDDATAKAFALADNRTAELGGYDDVALEAMVRDVLEFDAELLADTGWAGEDLEALLASVDELPPALEDPDAVPDSAPAITVPGDVWLLGPHRLLCGDSTVMESLPECDALISDPPYGMGLDTTWYGSTEVGSKFADIGAVDWDASPFDPSLFAEAAPAVALFGANYFCTRLPEPGTWWVWDKRTTSDGSGEIEFSGGMPFELIWLRGDRAHRIIRHLWSGYYRQAGTPAAERHNQHPTQKPVAVMAEVIEYLTEPGQTILDPFGGSGSTLIAAHQTGRVARLVELDPRYCDVICRRYQQATGDKPIAEATGRPHDFEADQ